MTAAIAVGVLVAAGVYLILQRGLIRVIIGFVVLGHAANIIMVAAGGMALRDAPLLAGADAADRASMADPLPQAFVLTAIVITFGITVYLLGLARAGGDEEAEADTLDPEEPVSADQADPGGTEIPTDDQAGAG
jgi:multicomponent Na+:H+ antiporter subunit C